MTEATRARPTDEGGASGRESDLFATTRWTVVLSAGQAGASEARAALAQLCETYWYPLYAFARRQRYTTHDAEDLTQAFFQRLLEKDSLGEVTREKGKFRCFLLVAFKHFLANEWDRKRRQKRGGGALHLSLDWSDAERRYGLEPSDKLTPDRVFDRHWALAVLETVLGQLRREHEAQGKAELFDHLKVFLSVGTGGVSYAEVAARTGMSEGAAKVAVHRLRRRYRELLRAEVAQTLSRPDQIEEEMQALFSAFAG